MRSLEELASTLDADPEFHQLSQDEQDQTFAELAKNIGESQDVKPSGSPFDSPSARALFQSGGQFLGGLTAGAMATPETFGAGTIPAAVAGGIGGGITGEALRQFFANRTGGGPSSYGQQTQGLLNAGGLSAATEAVPPLIGAVGKGIGRAIYRNIPDPVLSWVKTRATQGVDVLNFSGQQIKDNVFSAIQRMSSALKTIQQEPERLLPPSRKALYPVAEKAANALDAVRRQVGEQFGEVSRRALEQPARASLAQAGKTLTSELRQLGVINARNQPVPFGAREFNSEERILLHVFDDLRGMASAPTEGLPEAVSSGTFINYDLARRLIGRLDEALGVAKTKNTQRILGTVRRTIVEGLKKSDEGLARQIPAYAKFSGIRDAVESAFHDPDKSVQLLLSSLRDTKAGLLGQLEQLDALAPPELKFLPDLLQYQQKVTAAETAKRAPQTVSRLVNSLKTPQQMEKMIRSIFTQPETTIAELQALEETSGVKFLDELRDMAARHAFASFRPSGLGIPADLALGALGFGRGGPVGAGLGIAAGTALSTPRIQAEILRRILPPALFMGRMGQAIVPAAVTSVLGRTQSN